MSSATTRKDAATPSQSFLACIDFFVKANPYLRSLSFLMENVCVWACIYIMIMKLNNIMMWAYRSVFPQTECWNPNPRGACRIRRRSLWKGAWSWVVRLWRKGVLLWRKRQSAQLLSSMQVTGWPCSRWESGPKERPACFCFHLEPPSSSSEERVWTIWVTWCLVSCYSPQNRHRQQGPA